MGHLCNMIGRRPPARCSLFPDVCWPLQPGQLRRGSSVSSVATCTVFPRSVPWWCAGWSSDSMLSESPSTWCWVRFRRAGLARCACELGAVAVLAGGVTVLDSSAPPVASYPFLCACRLARYLRRAVVGRRWTRRCRNHRRRRIVTMCILCDFQNARVC